MPGLASLAAITLDTADHKQLSAFYRAALGWEEIWGDDKVSYLAGEGGVRLGFQKVEGYQAPEWPSTSKPQQFHLDLSVPDIEAAEKELVGLGATVATDQPGGERWRVLLDPSGHPFCLTSVV